MKRLVTQYHALNIAELARGGYLHPFLKYEWVWRTNKGTYQTTVSITVLTDALRLLVPMFGLAGVHQKVQLTYSLGPRGGKRPWFVCPTCPRRVGVLYHGEGLPFRCRTCCKLAYPSQNQSRDQSYGRQSRMVGYREQDQATTVELRNGIYGGKVVGPDTWPFVEVCARIAKDRLDLLEQTLKNPLDFQRLKTSAFYVTYQII